MDRLRPKAFWTLLLLSLGWNPSVAVAQADGTVHVAVIDVWTDAPFIRAHLRLDDGRVLPIATDGLAESIVSSAASRRLRLSASDLADGVVSAAEFTRGVATSEPLTNIVEASPQAPRFLTIPCQLGGGAALNQATYVQAMSIDFPGAELHVRLSSRNASNYDGSVVTATVTNPQPGSHYFSGTTTSVGTGFVSGFNRDVTLATDCMDALGTPVNLAEYDGVIVQHNLSLNASYAYLGPVPIVRDGVTHVKRLVINATWAGAGVYAHEIGHTYGFRHTQSRAGVQYSSKWSVMANPYAGSANGQLYGTLFSGVERTRAGWNVGRVRMLPINSSASLHITYPDAAPVAGDADVLLLPVAGPGRVDTIVVEARRPVAGTFESGIPGDAVVMHRIAQGQPTVVDVDGTDDPNDAGAQWLVGETYELPDIGLRIAISQQTASGFVVNVQYGSSATLGVSTTGMRPGGFEGESYADTMRATGTDAPATWSVAAGSLPPGLTLNAANGVITGVPMVVGTYTATVRAINADGDATGTITIAIAEALTITAAATRPVTRATVPVEDSLTVIARSVPTWRPLAGALLPPGLALTPTGVVRGTPTTPGTYSATLEAALASGITRTRTFTWRVAAPPLIIATTDPRPVAIEGEAYADTLRSSGGENVPPVWSLASGTLPQGLTLAAATGILTGVPSDTGTFAVTVRIVRDLDTATATLRYTVQSAMTITAAAMRPAGIERESYRDSLTVTARSTATWRLLAGTLPPGLSLAATGVVSGTPTTRGTYLPVFEATAGVVTRRLAASITIAAERLRIAGDTLRVAAQGYPISDTVRTTGGTGAALRWELRAGNLPTGVTLDNGVLLGATTATGDFPIVIGVRDDEYAATQALRLRLTPSLTVSRADSVRRGGQMGLAYADTLKAITVNDVRPRWSAAMPRGLTLSADGVIAGLPDTTGTFRVTARVEATFPAHTVTDSVRLVLTVQPPTVALDQIVEHILGNGTALPAAATRYLDQRGNGNGRFDVGDVLKWLQREGLLPANASTRDAMDLMMRQQRGTP